MRHLPTLTAALTALFATPALAATGPFFSLHNTNFIVLMAFILFLVVLVYFKVPGMLAGMLDKRADWIQTELDEARGLREEAQALLASYERQQREVREQAERIVAQARADAEAAADQAKADLASSLDRRMAAAEDQIASAEAAAVREVRDSAVNVAIAAARDVIANQMTAEQSARLIDDFIADVGRKLH